MSDLVANLGIAVIMPGLVYQAELDRESLTNALGEIGETLDRLTDLLDPDDRATYLMASAIDTARAFESGDMEQLDAIGEISFAFIYAYAQKQGFAQLADVRGIIAGLDDEEVVFKAYTDAEEFRNDTREMRQISERHREDTLPTAPDGSTLH